MDRKEVLVMRLSAMGDVAMTVPVVASFLAAHPEVHVTMLSVPRLAPLFSQFCNLTFVPVDTKGEYAGIFGMFKLFRKLRKMSHFDVMVDLHDVLRSKILRTLFRLTGTPVAVIDKGRSEKKALTQAERKVRKQLKSSIQRYQDTFRRAGFDFPMSDGAIFTDEALPLPSIPEIQNTGAKIVGIAPFAQHQGKIYPTDRTEQIVAHYAKKDGVRVLLFGGGTKEKEILDGWASRYANVVSLVGRFSLMEELAVLKHCSVLLSMDSANMHLASLVGTPVVSVWGATHPYAGFYGYGQKTEDAVQMDLPCRPCSIYGNKLCLSGDYKCLSMITPQDVINKMDKYLAD